MISVIGTFVVAEPATAIPVVRVQSAPRNLASALVEPLSGGALGSRGQARLTWLYVVFDGSIRHPADNTRTRPHALWSLCR